MLVYLYEYQLEGQFILDCSCITAVGSRHEISLERIIMKVLPISNYIFGFWMLIGLCLCYSQWFPNLGVTWDPHKGSQDEGSQHD